MGAGSGSSIEASSAFFSASGDTTFFRLVLVFLIWGATVTATLAPARRLSSSVDNVEGLIRPLVALAAISPSMVLVGYAPRGIFFPPFPLSHSPMLSRCVVLHLSLWISYVR